MFDFMTSNAFHDFLLPAREYLYVYIQTSGRDAACVYDGEGGCVLRLFLASCWELQLYRPVWPCWKTGQVGRQTNDIFSC